LRGACSEIAVKRILAVVFVIVGLCAIGLGGYRAITTLIGIYQSNLADPLGQPGGSESATSDQMLRGAVIGGAGLVLLLIGSVLWKLRPRSALGGA
jgi:hypothetical protein